MKYKYSILTVDLSNSDNYILPEFSTAAFKDVEFVCITNDLTKTSDNWKIIYVGNTVSNADIKYMMFNYVSSDYCIFVDPTYMNFLFSGKLDNALAEFNNPDISIILSDVTYNLDDIQIPQHNKLYEFTKNIERLHPLYDTHIIIAKRNKVTEELLTNTLEIINYYHLYRNDNFVFSFIINSINAKDNISFINF